MGLTAVQTTYSFKDLTGVLTNPLTGTLLQISGGNIGNGKIVVTMLTQRTEHDVANDGVVMPSYIPGANAEVAIDVQQTSALHHALLNLYNLVTTAADNGNLAPFAATILSLRTVLDGAGHFLSGVSFKIIPPKSYEAKGGRVNWVLMAANAINQ